MNFYRISPRKSREIFEAVEFTERAVAVAAHRPADEGSDPPSLGSSGVVGLFPIGSVIVRGRGSSEFSRPIVGLYASMDDLARHYDVVT